MGCDWLHSWDFRTGRSREIRRFGPESRPDSEVDAMFRRTEHPASNANHVTHYGRSSTSVTYTQESTCALWR